MRKSIALATTAVRLVPAAVQRWAACSDQKQSRSGRAQDARRIRDGLRGSWYRRLTRENLTPEQDTASDNPPHTEGANLDHGEYACLIRGQRK